MDIGELFEEPGEMSFVWRISDFMSLTHEVDMLYTSPNFIFSDACFCFLIYPYGETAKQSEGWIGLYLWRMDSGPPKTLSFSLSIRKTDGEEYSLGYGDDLTFTQERFRCGLSEALEISDLLNQKTELAPMDVLTVICTLKCDDHRHGKSSLFRRLWNLSLRLQNILHARKKTDVGLKMKDGEVPAHRIILQSRCEEFNHMFTVEMRESQTGEVNIEDGNEDAFKVFLSYVYSEDPEGLCSENVCEVYKLAHKYDVEELKKKCVQFMQQRLTVDTVLDVITMALLYQETALKEYAKDYFTEQKSEIYKTEKWKTMRKENPAIALDVLEYVFGD